MCKKGYDDDALLVLEVIIEVIKMFEELNDKSKLRVFNLSKTFIDSKNTMLRKLYTKCHIVILSFLFVLTFHHKRSLKFNIHEKLR